MGFVGGETKCICPKAKDVDLWILFWEVRRIHQEGTLDEVEYVKAFRKRVLKSKVRQEK